MSREFFLGIRIKLTEGLYAKLENLAKRVGIPVEKVLDGEVGPWDYLPKELLPCLLKTIFPAASDKELALIVSRSPSWIIERRLEIGFERKKGRKKGCYGFLNRISLDELLFLLLEGGKTPKEIKDELRLSVTSICRILREKGIRLPRDRKPVWYAKNWGIPELETPDWLLAQLENGSPGIASLARELGLRKEPLIQQIKRLGLDYKMFVKRRQKQGRIRKQKTR